MVSVGISPQEVAFQKETLEKHLNNYLSELKEQGYTGSEEEAKKKFNEQVAELYKNQGNEYLKNNRYDTAVDLYNAAIALVPSAVYYSNLAAAYFNAKDYSACLTACNDAIRVDPSFAKAYFRLGRVQRQLNEFEEALKSYDTSLKLDPKDENVRKARDLLQKEIEQLNK